MYKTADEARELSLTIVEEVQLERIAEEIDQAIIENRMAIIFSPYKYSPNTLERLYKDGYSITEILDNDDEDNPISISVSWSDRIKNKISEVKLSDDCEV